MKSKGMRSFLFNNAFLTIGPIEALREYTLQSPSIDPHVNELWLIPIFLDCGYASAIITFQTCGNKYILY